MKNYYCYPLFLFLVLMTTRLTHAERVVFLDGDFILDYEVDESSGTIEFTAVANTQGWVGIGLNDVEDEANPMVGAELMLGGVSTSAEPTPGPTTGTTGNPIIITQTVPDGVTTPGPTSGTSGDPIIITQTVPDWFTTPAATSQPPVATSGTPGIIGPSTTTEEDGDNTEDPSLTTTLPVISPQPMAGVVHPKFRREIIQPMQQLEVYNRKLINVQTTPTEGDVQYDGNSWVFINASETNTQTTVQWRRSFQGDRDGMVNIERDQEVLLLIAYGLADDFSTHETTTSDAVHVTFRNSTAQVSTTTQGSSSTTQRTSSSSVVFPSLLPLLMVGSMMGISLSN